MRKICFVCTGNTCRSPMAEKLLNMHLSNLNVKNVKVSSAGLCVEKDDKINRNSVLALKNYQIKSGLKKAKQLQKKDLKNDTIFITMTNEQKSALNFCENVFTIDEIAKCGNIPDPYGQDFTAYAETAKKLYSATLDIANKLKQSEEKK